MNVLQSGWTIGIMAVLINLGTTAALVYSQKDMILTARPEATVKPPPLLWSFRDDEVDKFVAELREQRKKVETREGDIEKLAAQLAAEREELKMVRNEIQSERDALTASIVEVQESESKNIKTLAVTYSSLSAPAAVAIISQLDELMAVKILSAMKPDKVGAIFQEMARPPTTDPTMVKRAARMSDKLRLLKNAKKEQPKQ